MNDNRSSVKNGQGGPVGSGKCCEGDRDVPGPADIAVADAIQRCNMELAQRELGYEVPDGPPSVGVWMLGASGTFIPMSRVHAEIERNRKEKERMML